MRGIEQYLQVDAATLGALKYAGTWNASTNTPTLASGVGTQGQYYVVSVAGSTNLDGETNWQVGDWAVFNGSVWQKVDGGSTGLLSTLTVTGNTYLATTSGNVGIGAIPTGYGKLEVYQSANNRILFSGAAAYGNNAIAGINDVGAEVSMGIAGSPVAFYTNATERMRITSAGNVGIGTSSLSNKFTVLYTDASAWAPNSTVATEMLFNNGALNNASATTLYQVVYGDSTTGGVKVGAVASGSYSADFVVANRNGGTFQENLRLTSSGNLGLGVTPSAWAGYKPLQAGTGASFGGYAGDVLSFVGSNTYNDNTNWRYIVSGNAAARYQQSAGVHAWYTAPSGTAGNAISFTQAMTLDASGNLGIGTSSPGTKLDVAGTFRIYQSVAAAYVSPAFENTNATGYVQHVFNVGSGGASGQAAISYAPGIFFAVGPTVNDTTTPIVFRNNNATERMRITSAGDVGIGTSSPAQKLSLSASAANVGIRLASVGGTGRDIDLISNTSGNLVVKSDLQANIATFDGILGNLGLGVTPSAWNSGVKALQIPYGAFWNVSDGVYLGTNYFLNSSAQRIYSNTGKFALEYLQYAFDGSHRWYTAPSGTAGNAISFTQAMTLNASGNLMVGTTTADGMLTVVAPASTGYGAFDAASSGFANLNFKTAGTIYAYMGSANAFVTSGTANDLALRSQNNFVVATGGGTERLRITSAGNIHTPAGATTMTNGFFYIPAAAGVPTGVPTAITGTVPMYYDTTNNKFYVYNGAWKSVTLT